MGAGRTGRARVNAVGRGHRLLVLAVVVLLASCSPSPGDREPASAGSPTSPRGDAGASGPTPSVTGRTPIEISTPRPNATPSPGSCAELVGSMKLRERVGQLFMAGADSRTGLTGRQAADLRRADVGSVILLGNTTAGRAAVEEVVDNVRAGVGRSRGVRLMLAADQEGGEVQRLQGRGFDRIPSAAQQGEMSDGRLRRDAEIWGRQLRAAGIDVNLAPVADVVPSALRHVNQPVGVLRRGYGSDPDVVAEKVAAFTTGMAAAGVLTSVKHFPGLGSVRGNTDFASKVVDFRTTPRGRDLAGFSSAVDAGVDMVMMSLAYYERIDPDRPAAFSPTVVGMVRRDLGFDGVVISDDLAARAARHLSPRSRALAFLDAGGDLMIVGDPGLVPEMAAAVRDKARADEAFADAVTRHATRILAMKARAGLAECA